MNSDRGDCAGNGNSFSNGPGAVAWLRALGWHLAEIKRDEPHWARLA